MLSDVVNRFAFSRPVFGALKTYSRLTPTGRGGFRLARLARRTLPRERWQGFFDTPDGLRLRLDLGTYPDCCMAFGLYELDTARLIRRLLEPGGWFVDCGANIGYFSLLAARQVGPAGRVDAFEPDPINRARLEQHLADNAPLPQVRVHPLAVGAEAATTTLFHPNRGPTNHGAASTFQSLTVDATDVSAFPVRVARLVDELVGVPHLIKLDVEGAELAAITGASGLLGRERPPAIIVEHNPVTAAAAGYRPSDLMRRLQAIQPRYRLYQIAWRLRPVAAPEQLDSLGRECNLLAVTA